MPVPPSKPAALPAARAVYMRDDHRITGAMPVAPQGDRSSFVKPLLVNAVPESRRTRRKRIRIAGAHMQGEGILRHRVTVVNVSDTGLQVQTGLKVQNGSRVQLSFLHDGRSYEAAGYVRFIRTLPPALPLTPPVYACGIEIDESAKAAIEALHASR